MWQFCVGFKCSFLELEVYVERWKNFFAVEVLVFCLWFWALFVFLYGVSGSVSAGLACA